MPAHLTLTATMIFKEPVDATVLDALAVLAAAVRQEPGCLEYCAHVHTQDPRRVLFYERWQDQAALDVHGKAAALTNFRAAMDAHLAGPSELQFWKRLG